MVVPAIVAVIYSEDDWIYFIGTAVPAAIVGFLLYSIKIKRKQLYGRDAYIITALVWIIMSLVGAVSLTVSGAMPDYLDAVFEIVSGFTTSGVTAFSDVEVLSHAVLFWRSLTHWIGGMGILVFMLAITSGSDGGSGLFIMRAESPGPEVDKVAPKLNQTAKYLYYAYAILTAIQIIALVIAELSVFDSFLVSFGTMATGGFAYLNTSLTTLTWAQQNIVTIFMFIAGINFALFVLAASGKPLEALKNEELRWYGAIFVIVSVLITVDVYNSGNYETVREAIHHTAFMVSSVITTTGYYTTDINVWPMFSQLLILFIMFLGACAGSTAGGIKVSRFAIMLKSARRYIRKIMHPRSVENVRFGGKEVSRQTEHSIMFYFCIFIVLFTGSFLIISLDPAMDDFLTAFSAVTTTISNNGVAFGDAGVSFGIYAWYSKVVFIIDMLIGRLEILPIMVLFSTVISPVTSISRKVKRKAI